MLIHPNLSLQLALAMQHERVAEAERWRQVAGTRPVSDESTTPTTKQRSTSSTLPGHRVQHHQSSELGAWLIRVGQIVAQYPTAELDGGRRQALGALVDGLLDAAREGGADVTLRVEADDPAVVLLRALGRLATYAAGGPIPVSRRRARMLRSALVELVDGSAAEVVQPRADAAA